MVRLLCMKLSSKTLIIQTWDLTRKNKNICPRNRELWSNGDLSQCVHGEDLLGDLLRSFISHDISWTYTLWLFNIAMENGPFIDGLPGFTY